MTDAVERLKEWTDDDPQHEADISAVLSRLEAAERERDEAREEAVENFQHITRAESAEAAVAALREALVKAAANIASAHECVHCSTSSGGHESHCPYQSALADTAAAAAEHDQRIRREERERLQAIEEKP